MTPNPNENQAEKHSAEQSNEHLYGVIYRKGLHEDDYDEAIQALKDAKNQSGVHYGCAICADTGHTAGQCHHNPLVMARRAVASIRSWRCFHCDEVFNDSQKAKEHFGDRESQEPKCVSAELSTLRKELEAARIAAGIRYSSVTLESEIQHFMAEADKVVKLQRELEASKKAQEWVQTHGLKFANSYERHVNYQGEGLKNLRELLNKKDGK